MIEFLQFSVQGLAAGSLYAIVAIGLVLLYRGTRVLNFAHGEFGALGAYVFWQLYPQRTWMFFALVAGVASGAAVGLVTERLVARPLQGSSLLTLAVATLAVSELVRAFIVAVFSPNPKFVPPLVTSPTLVVGRIILPAQRLLILVASLALSLLLALFLRTSLFGIAVRASAEDLTAVRLRGVKAGRMTSFVWAASAALAAVAAILVSPQLQLNPFFMTTVLIRAFAAALVGGLTSLGGALVGGLVVGQLEAHLQRYTSYPGAVEAALFGIIVVILLVRPEGLFGRRETAAAGLIGSGRAGLRLPFRLPRLPTVQAGMVAVAASCVVVGLAAVRGEYTIFLATVATTYAVVGVSIYMLTGLSGQLSLGHAAFMGVGGFIAGQLASRHGWPYAVSLVVGGVVAAAFAVAVGLPSFRIRGLYLAVSTLAFGIAAERYLFRLTLFAGGSAGVSLPTLGSGTVLVAALVLLLGGVVLAHRVRSSKAGRALAVLHVNETLAESWGIRTGAYKLLAFGLSGFLAGCAGVVYSTLIGQVTSEAFTLTLSINVVAMAIVGGLGSLMGVIAGSLFFALLPEALRTASTWLPVSYGGVLLAVVLFLPRGVAQLWTPAE